MNEPESTNLIDHALACLHEGDYVRALALGDQLAVDLPNHPTVRAIRAQALLGSDAPEESFQEARQAVELAPSDSHAHRLMALTAWRTGRLALAQDSFQRAVELSGQQSVVLSEYAWFMATERGPKLAEEVAKEAIAVDPNSSTAWAALGQAQFRLRRRSDAQTSLRRALELNFDDIYAQSAMIALLQDRRDDVNAEALVGMLEKWAGTEELVAAVRDDAKKRRIARMLVERNADLEAIEHPRHYGWVWLAGTGAIAAILSYFFDPRGPVVISALTIVLFVVLRRWLD